MTAMRHVSNHEWRISAGCRVPMIGVSPGPPGSQLEFECMQQRLTSAPRLILNSPMKIKYVGQRSMVGIFLPYLRKPRLDT